MPALIEEAFRDAQEKARQYRAERHQKGTAMLWPPIDEECDRALITAYLSHPAAESAAAWQLGGERAGLFTKRAKRVLQAIGARKP